MAAPKGHPQWGGRKKGTLNKSTVEIGALAREYGPEAIKKLALIMRKYTGAVAVAAARELLDRGYGKATEHIRNEFVFENMTEADLIAIVELNLPKYQGLTVDGTIKESVVSLSDKPETQE
jgi:hypothetical protein